MNCLEKLHLLFYRSFRYSYRKRLFRYIPRLVFEFLIPILAIFIIGLFRNDIIHLILPFFDLVFFIPCLFLLLNLIEDKKEKVKEILQLIGIESILNKLAHGIRSFLVLFILIICLTIILKFQLNDHSYSRILIIFLSYLILSLQNIGFAILTAHFFKQNLFAILWNLTFWILSIIAYFYITNCSIIIQYLFIFLSPYIAQRLIFQQIILNDQIPSDVWLIMILSWILTWILAWDFRFQCWRKRSNEFNLRERNSKGKPILCVNHLTKKFQDDQIVLDDISFNFYENENICLLGSKYSGKTMLFNCLVGLSKQTSGEISIETPMNTIGICPEFNILFDFYTVNEQIEFYSKIRRHEIGFDILGLTQLEYVKNLLCQCLSSEMKRRLSIACAFIAETKIIFLDESSNRFDRLIYSLTNGGRKIFRTKTILNEDLFDRILILSNGKLQFNDTQDKFYNQFNFNSKLIVKKTSQFSIDDLFNYFPSIKIQTDNLNENYILYLKTSLKNQSYDIENSRLIANQCNFLFESNQISQGLPFYFNQFIGLLIKYLLVHCRNYFLIFNFFFSPILFNFLLKSQTKFIYENQFSFHSFSVYFLFFYTSIFILKDREERLMSLLITNGLHPMSYWLSTYIFDLIISSIWLIYSIGISLFFFNQSFNYYEILIIIPTLPLIYLLTKFFHNPIIGSLTISITLFVLNNLILFFNLSIRKFIYWIINFLFPTINSQMIIFYILSKKNHLSHSLSLIINETIVFNISLLFFQLIVYFLILFIIDCALFRSLCFQIRHDHLNLNSYDEDVLAEQHRVLLEEDQHCRDYLLVNNLVKSYSKNHKSAIDYLTFGIKRGEIFGLFGRSGSGKTTSCEIIVGELSCSKGIVYINGYDIRNRIQSNYRLGYCPQINFNVKNLKVYECLSLFARIRGIKLSNMKIILQTISSLFHLETVLKYYICQLSEQTKRQLHIAIAFLGLPSIIILDEAMINVDSHIRQQIHQILLNARKHQLTILLTSQSIDQSERICDRLGVLVNGQLVCLGTTEHLKLKFCHQYDVRIKLCSNTIKEFCSKFQLQLKSRIQIKELTSSIGLVRIKTMRASELFHLLEDQKQQWNIESYTISQITLEENFLSSCEEESDAEL